MFWTIVAVAVAMLLSLCWIYDRRQKRRHTLQSDQPGGPSRSGPDDSTIQDYGARYPRGPHDSGGQGGSFSGG